MEIDREARASSRHVGRKRKSRDVSSLEESSEAGDSVPDGSNTSDTGDVPAGGNGDDAGPAGAAAGAAAAADAVRDGVDGGSEDPPADEAGGGGGANEADGGDGSEQQERAVVPRSTGEPAGDYTNVKFIRETFGIGPEHLTPPVTWRTSRTKINEWMKLGKIQQQEEINKYKSLTKPEQAAAIKNLPPSHKKRSYYKPKPKSKSTTKARKKGGRRAGIFTDHRSTRANPDEETNYQYHDDPEALAKAAQSVATQPKKKKRKVGSAPTKASHLHDAAVINSEDALFGRLVTHQNMTCNPGNALTVKAYAPMPPLPSSTATATDGTGTGTGTSAAAAVVAASSVSTPNQELRTIQVPANMNFVLIMQTNVQESAPAGAGGAALAYDPTDSSRSKITIASTSSVDDTKKMLVQASMPFKSRNLPPEATSDYNIIGMGDWSSVRTNPIGQRTTGSLTIYDGNDFGVSVGQYQDERSNRRSGVRRSGPLTNEETNQHVDSSVGTVASSPTPNPAQRRMMQAAAAEATLGEGSDSDAGSLAREI